MAYTFPHTLVAGTPENVTDVMDNFTGHAADTEYAYSTYKLILSESSYAGSGLASAVRFFSDEVLQDPTNGTVGFATHVFYIDKADYTSASRTTKFRVRAQLSTNATAPAITYTVGLYPVSAVGGSGSDLSWTVGTVTSGSTVAFATPSASTLSQSNSGDFNAPAAGHYALGVLNSGAAALNSRMNISAQLQMRQV